MFTVVVATLAVNIAANTVSPANDFANAFPRRIDFKRGGLVTGIIGVADDAVAAAREPDALPRQLARRVLGAALGSIAGVLIVDYWIIRKRTLELRSLYSPDGAYRYTRGWHMPAVIATVIGFGVALLGAFWPPMRPLYNWSWFVAFGLSGGVYLTLAK